MSTYIVGFVFAVIVSAVLMAWIAYYMFCRERHKSERFQHDISDLRRKNYEIAQEQQETENTKEVTAGVFILPSRHKQKDDFNYDKRPDYPEGTVRNLSLQPKTEKLIDILNDTPTDERKCVEFDMESNVKYHSDV